MDVVKTFLSSHQPRCEFNTLMLIVSLCKLFYITHCAFGMPSDHVTHSWAYQNTSEVMLRDVGKLIRSRSPRHSFLWRTLLPKQAPDCQSKLLKLSMFENCYMQVYRLMMVSRISRYDKGFVDDLHDIPKERFNIKLCVKIQDRIRPLCYH